MHLREQALALALLNYGLTFSYNQGKSPILVSFADEYAKSPSAWQMSGLEILLPPYHFSKNDSDYCTCGATPNRHKHPHFCPCLLSHLQSIPVCRHVALYKDDATSFAA